MTYQDAISLLMEDHKRVQRLLHSVPKCSRGSGN